MIFGNIIYYLFFQNLLLKKPRNCDGSMPGFGTWSKSIIFMVKTFAVYLKILIGIKLILYDQGIGGMTWTHIQLVLNHSGPSEVPYPTNQHCNPLQGKTGSNYYTGRSL
jgi:hypothetical protein